MSWRMDQVCERTLTLHPAEIVGQGRPRMDTRNRRTYTPAKTARAEAADIMHVSQPTVVNREQ